MVETLLLPLRYREEAEKKENLTLHPQAAFSKNHQRFLQEEDDYRLPYKRDVDRIIHSKAYSRYIDKTQVVYLVHNDHITHRGLHVQLVSNFARGIAEVLRLNVDLVEAIALGHDVGHPPFGHEGEGYLSQLSEEHGNGPFAHPWQSCRLLREIEPLNLGLNVFDGFLCHDGGMCGTQFTPHYGKTWDDHFKDLDSKLKDPEKNIWPATLEGCLVKLCDTMSYIGRDIEDAIHLGIIQRSQIPETYLGKTNKEILSNLAVDVITTSYNQEHIGVSQRSYDALSELRSFNFKMIYNHPKLKVESHKIKKGYKVLFHLLLESLNEQGENSYIWKQFLHNKSEKYLADTKPIQCVVDYISGMTDTYFVHTLENLILPRTIEL